MDTTLVIAITGLATAILGGLGTIYAAWRTGQQTQANARQTDANTAQIRSTVKKTELDILRDSMEGEIARLNAVVTNVFAENEKLRDEVKELASQVTLLNIKYEREHEYAERLKAYIVELTRIMEQAGLTLPVPMPELKVTPYGLPKERGAASEDRDGAEHNE